jgi:hypothetical protein
VCGGGPTGVEAAAEIYDFCQEDIMRYYPKVCRVDVSIHVIQSREHILNTVLSLCFSFLFPMLTRCYSILKPYPNMQRYDISH